jgi:hypothetical protein
VEVKKSIKKPKTVEKKKFESSFTFVTFKLFFAKKFFLTFTYHPLEGTKHQKNKN